MTEHEGQKPGEPAGEPISVPPGWYHDPSTNASRWWDGSHWTDAYAPGEQQEAAEPAVASAAPTTGADQPVPVRVAGVGKPSKNTLIALGAIAALVVVAIIGVLISRSQSDEITVDYSITIIGDCTSGGYDDIGVGTQVEVTNGGGDILGFGNLSEDGDCSFSASFPVDESDDGVYRVTSGNENRGYLNYNQDDVVDGTLTVFATLG